MKYLPLLLLVLAGTAQAAKDCSKDGTAGLSVVPTGPQMDFSTIPLGSKVCSLGESNTDQIFGTVVLPGRTLVNSSDGGCAIGNYARYDSTKGKSCWSKMPASCDVIWIKPINRSNGMDPNVYTASVVQDLVIVLGEVEKRIDGVNSVYLSGHHATPYADGWIDRNGNYRDSKQGEPYSHDSIYAILDVIEQYQRAWSFDLILGVNLWGTSSEWTCDLFDPDGVHLNDKGNLYAGSKLVGGSAPPPDPDPDPDPEPQQCEATVSGQTCSIKTRSGGKQYCICQNPWSRTQL